MRVVGCGAKRERACSGSMKTKSEEVAAIRSKADEELEKLAAQGVKVRPKDA